jgi:hypothetical protein
MPRHINAQRGLVTEPPCKKKTAPQLERGQVDLLGTQPAGPAVAVGTIEPGGLEGAQRARPGLPRQQHLDTDLSSFGLERRRTGR